MLLDVEMPGAAVTAVVHEVGKRRPDISVIILTMHSDAAILRSLLYLGIRGYLLKTASRHELISAIMATRSKSNKVTLAVSRDVLIERELPDNPARLSLPETNVLWLAAQGLTNGQIGRQLSLTEPSVKRYMRNVFAKLGAVSRIDAVNKAREAGLLTSNQPVAREHGSGGQARG
jgi:DNA-binding NarL/FixJ family response regulator